MNKKYRFFEFSIRGRAILIGAGILCVYGLAACARLSSSPPAISPRVATKNPHSENRITIKKSDAASANAQTAFASQIPNEGPLRDEGRSIGRRASLDAGTRASLRMLSRLIKTYPDRDSWTVYWEASPKRGGKIQKYSTYYDPGWHELGWMVESGDKEGDYLYHAAVVEKDIFVVAGYSGTFKDIQKRLDDPYRDISRTIGRQASLDDGNRACLRMLSRLIKTYPDAQSFEVDWSARLKGHLIKTGTTYLKWESSVNRQTSVVPYASSIMDSEKLETKLGPILIDGVGDADIHAVAHYHGNFEDLQKRIHGLITRSIGRRSSTVAGVRASLRMLSRLIKAYPNSPPWTVDWEAPKNGNEIQEYSTSYDYFGTNILSCMTRSGVELEEFLYYGKGVMAKDIHVVAQYSGTFNDIQKRLDDPHRHITRTIGGRATVNDGNRASLRMLSQLIKAYPNAQTYTVPWSVVLKGHLLTTRTNYLRWEKSVTRETFSIPDTLIIFHTKKFRVKLGTIFVDGVSDADINAVARRSGSFRELHKKVRQNNTT
jgi:hypothetical protein